MIGIKNCGFQITAEDYAALSQDERNRLAELVNGWRKVDKLTPFEELRRRAYFKVTAESIPFEW